MASRQEKLAALHWILDQDLPPVDLSLIRDLTHHYAMGTEREWGLMNPHRAEDVARIFQHVSPS